MNCATNGWTDDKGREGWLKMFEARKLPPPEWERTILAWKRVPG